MDCYQFKGGLRPNLSQASQIHQLMVRGKVILESLFPGIEQEFLDAGAVPIDWPKDVSIVYGSQLVPRFSLDLLTLCMTRSLLDQTIKSRLQAFNGFEIVEGNQVTELLYDPEKKRVTGVSIRTRYKGNNDDNSSSNSLLADLVVDATGRFSKAPKWLASHGYIPPQATVVDASIGYASRFYRPSTNSKIDWKAVQMWPRPPYVSGGGIYPVEGNLWHVALIGINGNYPPTDETRFLEFSKTLPSLELYEAIKNAEPVSCIYSYRQTENRLYQYEKIPKMPGCFIIIGDAVCALNPVYGQGITLAALGALTLDDLLKKDKYKDSNFAQLSIQFQKQLAKITATPWLLATTEDFNWSQTKGIRPQPWFIYSLVKKYMNKLLEKAAQEQYICQSFAEVMHMLKPITSLFTPRMLYRVLLKTTEKPASARGFNPQTELSQTQEEVIPNPY